MHIIDIFHFFLGDSKLIRVLNGSSIYFHALHDHVLTIHLVEKALLQDLLLSMHQCRVTGFVE